MNAPQAPNQFGAVFQYQEKPVPAALSSPHSDSRKTTQGKNPPSPFLAFPTPQGFSPQPPGLLSCPLGLPPPPGSPLPPQGSPACFPQLTCSAVAVPGKQARKGNLPCSAAATTRPLLLSRLSTAKRATLVVGVSWVLLWRAVSKDWGGAGQNQGPGWGGEGRGHGSFNPDL